MLLGHGMPLAHDGRDRAGNLSSCGNAKAKLWCDFEDGLHGGRRIRLVDRKRVHTRPDVGWHRIEVIRRCETPPIPSWRKPVVAQVVVGVRHQDVEHEPAPELLQIGVGLRAILPRASTKIPGAVRVGSRRRRSAPMADLKGEHVLTPHSVEALSENHGLFSLTRFRRTAGTLIPAAFSASSSPAASHRVTGDLIVGTGNLATRSAPSGLRPKPWAVRRPAARRPRRGGQGPLPSPGRQLMRAVARDKRGFAREVNGCDWERRNGLSSSCLSVLDVQRRRC